MMQRRDFLKISVLSGATLALESCGSPDHQLIRFIPEEQLVPGVATWKPGVCTLCPGGCGVVARVMEGDAEVVRHGQRGLIKMGLAKKLEGNPAHPVNRGKLCARGQAGLQALYNPDRLTNPLKRSGPRGSGLFQEVTWEDALKELTGRLAALHGEGKQAALAFLGKPLRGHRRVLIERFLGAYGAPPPVSYELLDEAVLRRANQLSFGRAALPTVDLARADYLLSFGADFLGTWNSPVAQSIGYGELRRGRSGHRGKFVQVEPRMSQTGANADAWVACRPGTEGVLALGIAHVIISEKRNKGAARTRAGELIAGWNQGLPGYDPASVEKRTGVAQATIVGLAREIAGSGKGVVISGGAPLAQTNGMFTALAVNALESLVDVPPAGAAPLLSFTPEPPWKDFEAASGPVRASYAGLGALTEAIRNEGANAPQLLMLYEANPLFAAPPGAQFREALEKVPYIASFGSFADETSMQADLILPDDAPLESWLDDVPESGTSEMVATLAPPAVLRLHNTRAMADVILEVARGLGGKVAAAVPWKDYSAMLRAAFAELRPKGSKAPSEEEFWSQVQKQGGWWSAPGSSRSSPPYIAAPRTPAPAAEPRFEGDAAQFPFHFLPYASPSFRDGALANLPWLQELPDVVTTAMWSSWVEVNPQTAGKLKIQTGDLVEIASPEGKLRVAAVVMPGIAPDVVAMPIGQGHQSYGRYASGRGANPVSILAPLTEPETGALAWAGTRVALRRVGGPEREQLILFAGGMSRFPEEQEPR